MAEQTVGVSPLAVFVTLTLFTVIIGYVAYLSRKKLKATSEDYLIAGRTIGIIATFFGIYTTQISVWTFLGLASLGYSMGIGAIILAAGACYVFNAYIGARICSLGHKLRWMTQADYFADRFESKVWMRILVPIIGIISLVTGHIMVQFTGIAQVFTALTGGMVPYIYGLVYAGALMILFLYLGGLRGTAWTDIIFGSFMLGLATALVLLFYSVLSSQYGLTVPQAYIAVSQNVPKVLTLPGIVPYFTYAVLISWLFWGFGFFFGQPHMFMWNVSAKSPRVLKLFPILMIPAMLLTQWYSIATFGVLSRVLYPDKPPVPADQIIPYFVATFVKNEWLAPVLLLGVLSAALSTAAGASICLGGMVVKNIIRDVIKPDISEKTSFRLSRVFAVVFVILGGVLAFVPPQYLALVLVVSIGWVAPLVPPIFLGLYWKRANKCGAYASIIAGELLALYLMVFPKEWGGGYGSGAAWLGFFAVFWVIVIGTVVCILVSYLTSPPSKETIQKFFEEEKR